MVDGKGGSASFTGSECMDWAGGRTGPCYAAQGNILVSAETVDAIAETFEGTAGAPLAERLLDCLDAAQAAGGDRRGQQSAALLVVERDGGYAGLTGQHRRPAGRRARAAARGPAAHLRHAPGDLGKTPSEDWLDVDDGLATELRERLGRLGFEGELDAAFNDWAGKENLEERVDGVERVDPVVLDELRRQT